MSSNSSRPACNLNLNSPETEALFPDNSNLQNRLPTIDSICQFGLTPLLMSGIIRDTLINHFSSHLNMISPVLRKYFTNNTYALSRDNGGDQENPIFIDTLDRWTPTLSEARPAFVIKDADWTFTQLGINNRVHTELRTGEEAFLGLWSGAHTVFALASESGLAKILATEAAKLLLWQSLEIQRTTQLIDFKVMKLGCANRCAESTTNYVVPVDVGYVAQESWTLIEDAPRLKQIKFSATNLLRDY